MAILRDVLLWFAIGSLISLTVFKRARMIENGRRRQIFFGLIVLLGPLNLLFAFVPVDIVLAFFVRVTDLFEKRVPGQLTARDRAKLLAARQKYLNAYNLLDSRMNEELRKIGGGQ
jgi:hypothetical protein